MTEPDVVIIGGGATGAGVARDLSLRGVDVTLLERGGLLSGTTGRSHGLLHSGARYAVEDSESARDCIRERQIVAAIAGAAVEETGGLFVSLAGDDPDYVEEKRRACESCDIPVEELSGDAARERVPELSADVERALAVPDAVVYPSRLVAATADDARRNGATVRTDAPVTDLRVEEGRLAAVHTDDAVYEPRYVVNATGAWAGEVAALAGVEVEMRPTAGAMVAVDRSFGPVVNRCRAPDDGDIVVPHRDRAVLGTTSEAVSDPDAFSTSDEAISQMVDACAEMLPAVEEASVEASYWGVRPLYAGDATGREASRGFELLDHADDGVADFCSVVGGKLTTHRLMAEVTSDRVCEALGREANCRTDVEELPAADDPERLDALVAEFGGAGPADADVVGSGRP